MNRYEPFTEEEFLNLKEVSQSITTYIPKHLMGLIWSSYKRIAKSTEPQPCNCGSSAGHWRKAMNTVREFLNERE